MLQLHNRIVLINRQESLPLCPPGPPSIEVNLLIIIEIIANFADDDNDIIMLQWSDLPLLIVFTFGNYKTFNLARGGGREDQHQKLPCKFQGTLSEKGKSKSHPLIRPDGLLVKWVDLEVNTLITPPLNPSSASLVWLVWCVNIFRLKGVAGRGALLRRPPKGLRLTFGKDSSS